MVAQRNGFEPICTCRPSTLKMMEHSNSTNRNSIKSRIIRAIYYWYNTRSSRRFMCRLAATPLATWPARTQYMTAQQHTRNQPLDV